MLNIIFKFVTSLLQTILMKYFFILSLISLLVCCCKKDEKPYTPVQRSPELTRNMDSIQKYIHGSWIWLEEKRWDRTIGVYKYLTPETEGYSARLEMSGDTARFYKNNLPDSSYKFQVLRESDISNWPDDSLPVLVFYLFSTGERQTYVPIKICKDQLLMQYEFVSSTLGEKLWRRY